MVIAKGRPWRAVGAWNLVSAPVGAGRLLLLITGLVVMISVAALRPSPSDWVAITTVSGVMFTVLLSSFLIPWASLPSGTAFFFPVAVCLGLAALGLSTRADIGSCYTGLFVLCFAYVGLYLPRHTSLALAPVAGPCLVAALDRWNPYIQIRLGIALAIWIILGDVIALLTHRHRDLTNVLREAARTDALTGLRNRRDLDTRLTTTQPGDTLVICDLDHFKQINDTHGHARGDQVLQHFGAILTGALRGDDYAGRYGGEEFVLILTDTTAEETSQVLHRLHKKWASTEPGITFSAGYQTHHPDDTPTTTLAAADAALYTAKQTGRNKSIHAQIRLHGTR